MTEPDFPVLAGPPQPEEKLATLARAVGKTVASVEYGSVDPSPDQPAREATIIHFADGSSVALVAGLAAGGVSAAGALKAGDTAVALTVVWKDESEWRAFDEVMGL